MWNTFYDTHSTYLRISDVSFLYKSCKFAFGRLSFCFAMVICLCPYKAYSFTYLRSCLMTQVLTPYVVIISAFSIKIHFIMVTFAK